MEGSHSLFALISSRFHCCLPPFILKFVFLFPLHLSLSAVRLPAQIYNAKEIYLYIYIYYKYIYN
jgi:hypothetical protein